MRLVHFVSGKNPEVVVHSHPADIEGMLKYLKLVSYYGEYYYKVGHFEDLGFNSLEYIDYYKVVEDDKDWTLW